MTLPSKARHPAKFNEAIIDKIVHAIQWHMIVPQDALYEVNATHEVHGVLINE